MSVISSTAAYVVTSAAQSATSLVPVAVNTAINHPVMTATAVGIVAAPLIVPSLLSAVGFSVAGPVLHSGAAGIQSVIATGGFGSATALASSAFSLCQSVAMGGMSWTAVVTQMGIGGATARLAAAKLAGA